KEEAINELTKELEEITDKVDKNKKPLKDEVMENGKEKTVEKTEAPPLLYGNPDDYKVFAQESPSIKELEVSIDRLLKDQEEILKSTQLSDRDKDILDSIEKELTTKLAEINALNKEKTYVSNEATENKLERLDKNIAKLKTQEKELESKIERFLSVNKELKKDNDKLKELTLKYNEIVNLPKEKKKAEKLKKEIDKLTKKLDSKLSVAFKKERASLDKKIEKANKEKEVYLKENLVNISSEVELSKKNFEVLTSKDVQESIKKDLKDKLGLVIDGEIIKFEDTAIIQLETNSLDKMSYDVTKIERDKILDEIKKIEKIEISNISKEIADSVILSSKTLSKDDRLQKDIQSVVDRYLNSTSELTMETLIELNKNIRVEEVGEKEVFKKEDLTKDEAIFSNSLVSQQYLENFVVWYNNSNDLDPLEKAALAYQRLMTYHPFEEGNGRVVRVLVNKILLENGYVSLPKFSDSLTKKVLPQTTGDLNGESYTAKEFVSGFIDEIKKEQEKIVKSETQIINNREEVNLGNNEVYMNNSSAALKSETLEKQIDQLMKRQENILKSMENGESLDVGKRKVLDEIEKDLKEKIQKLNKYSESVQGIFINDLNRAIEEANLRKEEKVIQEIEKLLRRQDEILKRSDAKKLSEGEKIVLNQIEGELEKNIKELNKVSVELNSTLGQKVLKNELLEVINKAQEERDLDSSEDEWDSTSESSLDSNDSWETESLNSTSSDDTWDTISERSIDLGNNPVYMNKDKKQGRNTKNKLPKKEKQIQKMQENFNKNKGKNSFDKKFAKYGNTAGYKKAKDIDGNVKIERSKEEVTKQIKLASQLKEITPLAEAVTNFLGSRTDLHKSQSKDGKAYITNEKLKDIGKNPELSDAFIKLYEGIGKDSQISKNRDKMDGILAKSLLKNQELKKILSSENISATNGDVVLKQQETDKIFNIVFTEKAKAYKEVYGNDYAKEKPKLLVTNNQEYIGAYGNKENALKVNVDSDIKEIFEAVIHELTHFEQVSIVNDKTLNLPQHEKDIITINYRNYINDSESRPGNYEKQLIESEAYKSGKDIKNKVVGDSEVVINKETNPNKVMKDEKATARNKKEAKKAISKQELEKVLKTTEYNAILKYTDEKGGYSQLNKALRETGEPRKVDEGWVRNLDSALKKVPKYEGKVVRTVDLPKGEALDKFLAQHKEGSEITYNEYVSTSKKELFELNPTVTIEIPNSTEGRDISKLGSHEGEVLYERGSKFKVVEVVKKKNGTYKIKLEENLRENNSDNIFMLKEKQKEGNGTLTIVEHIFKDKTGNLEDPLKPEKSELKDLSLIYGSSGSKGRDGLINSIKTNEKNPVIADVFLNNANTIFLSEGDSRLPAEFEKFIEEYSKGDVKIEILNNFLNTKLETIPEEYISNLHYDKINDDVNKIILEKMKGNSKFNKIIKKLYQSNQALSKVENQLNEEKIDVIERKKLHEKNNKDLELFKDLLKQFWSLKTITILEATLESGGQIYFTLDGIATSKDKNGEIYLDEEKLNDILKNPSSPYYDAVTSQELRVIYKKFIDYPNLKLLINKQVISNTVLKKKNRNKIKRKEEGDN
ncbi:MAG: Fic family protein, partial [Cetobacterium sp.]